MNLNLKFKFSGFIVCLVCICFYYYKRIYWDDEGELLGVNVEIRFFGYLNLIIGYDIIELRLFVGLR